MKKLFLVASLFFLSQWAHADLLDCRFSGGAINDDPNSQASSAGPLSIFAGQVGAPTASPPQPSGQILIRSNNGNTAGIFTFGGGTSSAPPGTEIDSVSCSEPGFCANARPGPWKNISFDGIGTFQNIGRAGGGRSIGPESVGGATLHWFEVSIWDQGEPGAVPDESGCPPGGPAFGARCDCPDWYSIKIYDAVSINDVIYEASGYIDGGNLQIHPPN